MLAVGQMMQHRTNKKKAVYYLGVEIGMTPECVKILSDDYECELSPDGYHLVKEMYHGKNGELIVKYLLITMDEFKKNYTHIEKDGKIIVGEHLMGGYFGYIKHEWANKMPFFDLEEVISSTKLKSYPMKGAILSNTRSN